MTATPAADAVAAADCLGAVRRAGHWRHRQWRRARRRRSAGQGRQRLVRVVRHGCRHAHPRSSGVHDPDGVDRRTYGTSTRPHPRLAQRRQRRSRHRARRRGRLAADRAARTGAVRCEHRSQPPVTIRGGRPRRARLRSAAHSRWSSGPPPSAPSSVPTSPAPARPSPTQIGIPDLAGPMLFSAIGFAIAGVMTFVLLRPDPLVHVAERRTGRARHARRAPPHPRR